MTNTLSNTVISSVLIANRGEIAERIIRSCRELGIRAIVVHSDADAEMPFVAAADQAIRLGATTADSYLNGEAIIQAAVDAGADAIHPGYGFLSENADFAAAVATAGLRFIGPSAEVIEQMGRKDRARLIAERAGVPVTPQYQADSVPADAWPVLVKAAAGGGGKGMHIARDAQELEHALATAAREAKSAFGDDTLLIEKYVPQGRHIEVQVFGDSHGNVVHLFERDCSVQRRHQKVIEEAPACGLSDQVRATVLDAAVALCREVGYTNAGTVEFLVDGDDAWFLEMNTRLQVEHPVTEEVTGLDLVDWQLRVAAGEVLPLKQEQITCTGHAIEVRVYSEDPYRDFLPQTGDVRELIWPTEGVRIESGITSGVRVGTAFDPMLAKVIVHRAERDQAIAAMIDALDHSAILGVTTNIGFVRQLLDSQPFRAGDIHTSWLDTRPEAAFTAPECPTEVLAEAARLLSTQAARRLPADGWRLAGPTHPARLRIHVEGTDAEWIEPAAITPAGVYGVSDGARAWLSHQGQSWVVAAADGMRRDKQLNQGGPDVLAPMPGLILLIEVSDGQRVEIGDRLGVMEAMKMELSLTAPIAGTVSVKVAEGAQVSMGHTLFEIEADDD